MPIPWSQDTLPNPTEPLTANQASLWVTMLRRLQRLVGGRFLADPGIIFLLSFDDGYVEQKHALTAEIEHPAPIVTGSSLVRRQPFYHNKWHTERKYYFDRQRWEERHIRGSFHEL